MRRLQWIDRSSDDVTICLHLEEGTSCDRSSYPASWSASRVLRTGKRPTPIHIRRPSASSTDRIDGIVVRAAEKVSEDVYAFKPTPEVRTFGEVVGHIVDAHYLLCRAAHENVFEIKREYEKKPGTKADLLAALKKSIAYCEQAFDGTTDANGTTIVNAGGPIQKLMVLNLNVSHTWEHYGNLVTYMRLKGIVPPTSEPPAK